ncbi:PAS domain S-box protein [candidate division KSB1 bacterium]|nr:PAS domain S-box protein [candidate division KSB1 bacterium]
MATVRILVVEDERIVAKDLQLSLQKLGYSSVTLAYSGQEAIRTAAEIRPDLVLMDIMLNDTMDGIQAASHIREHYDIPVIYLTAYSDEKTLHRAMISEPFGYILKPYEERDLLTAIEMALYKHKMETKLRQREQWLLATLTSIGDAVITTDRMLNITFMNPVACLLTSRSSDESMGLPLQKVFHVKSDTNNFEISAVYKQVLKKGIGYRFPHPLQMPGSDSHTLSIDLNLSPIRSTDGSIDGLVLAFRDITAHEMAKQAMLSSEELFRTVWEGSVDGMRLVDQDGNTTLVNEAFCQLVEMSASELAGKPFSMIHNDSKHIQNLQIEFPERFRTRSMPLKAEHQMSFRSGKVRFIEITNSFIELEDRGPYLLSIFRDITQRKETEQQLKNSEEKYRLLFQNNLVGVGISETNGKILETNHALGAMFNFSDEQFSQYNVTDFFINERDRNFLKEQLNHHNRVENYELPLRKANGETFWANISSVVIQYGNKNAYLTTHVDVTARKQMEIELEQSKERYRVLSELTSDFAYGYRVTPDGAMFPVWATDAIVRISGYDKSALFSTHSWIDIVHNDDKPIVKQQKQQLLNGQTSVVEYRIIAKDGTIHWLRDYGRPVLDRTSQKVSSILGAIQDITAQKQALEALQMSEERFRTVFESAEDIIFIKDRELRYTQINPAVQAIFMMDIDHFIGKTDNDLFASSTVAQTSVSDQRVLAGNVFDGEEQFTIDDTNFIMHVIKVPMRNANEEITGLCGIARDVTERKRAAEALNAERERLGITLRSIADGVISTNKDGQVSLMNPVAEKLTGWKQEDALGRNFNDIFRASDEKSGQSCEQVLLHIMSDTRFTEMHKVSILHSRSGERFIVACSAAPIKDNSATVIGLIFVFRDITEQRKVEGELQKASKLESIGLLAGGIAHDFNNILTVILSSVSLSKMLIDSNPDLTEILTDMERATLRAQDLTQQLLTFSKGGAPVKQLTSIGGLLRESTKFSLRGSKVSCNYSIPNDLWAIEADQGQLSQVINNLIINADQAMPEGGTIELTASNITIPENTTLHFFPGRYVKISIKDLGIGISNDHLVKIYDPYFTTKQSGSGLGLTTSYSIIKKHDGYMDVESKLGEGTIFHIYLPASSESLCENHHEEVSFISGSGSILIMDDEPIVLRAAGRILNRLGYSVTYAADGIEAINKYKQAQEEGNPIDALILDLTVPGGLGGKETLEQLLSFDPEVTAIVSSGYSNDPVMSSYQDYGFKGIVKKPYRVNELASIIQQVIKVPA